MYVWKNPDAGITLVLSSPSQKSSPPMFLGLAACPTSSTLRGRTHMLIPQEVRCHGEMLHYLLLFRHGYGMFRYNGGDCLTPNEC